MNDPLHSPITVTILATVTGGYALDEDYNHFYPSRQGEDNE